MGTRTVVLMEDPVPAVPLGGLTVPVPPCSNIRTPVPVRALAMPCPPVTPRRKPRFTVATPWDIETYPVEVFK
eukprot:13787680-Heterocapsa_arctica.AAC.1